MKPPKCRLCDHEHWLNQPHVFATNTETATNGATNNATNEEGNGATNISVACEEVVKADDEKSGVSEVTSGAGEGSGSIRPGVGVVGRTGNRRSREAYNAYQRDYMRKKRAKVKVLAAV